MASDAALAPTRVVVAADRSAASGLIEQLLSHRHQVLCAATSQEAARLFEASERGWLRPPDVAVVHGSMLSERVREALRRLRIRDRTMVLVVLAEADDDRGREVALRLRASIVTAPLRAADVGFVLAQAKAGTASRAA